MNPIKQQINKDREEFSTLKAQRMGIIMKKEERTSIIIIGILTGLSLGWIEQSFAIGIIGFFVVVNFNILTWIVNK